MICDYLYIIVTTVIVEGCIKNEPFNLSFCRPAKTVPFVILLCLTPDNFTHQWRASGWERVNWAYLPILFLNLSSPSLAKTVPFVILLCLMPNNFTYQWRASGWERVNIKVRRFRNRIAGKSSCSLLQYFFKTVHIHGPHNQT